MSNTQHKLDKVRPPRVQITYDVEVGNAQTAKELPLVIGVLGDFTQPEQSFANRHFVNIDRDNFNDIMDSMKPNAEFLVDSVLPGQNGQLKIELTFQHMDDFSPDKVVLQIDPLRQLMDLREQLCDLRNRAASNERLKAQLVDMAQRQSAEGNVLEDKSENE
ncbi:TPA: type VI secretion system contractile sheath small subunit [Providencia alcalifaciens]